MKAEMVVLSILGPSGWPSWSTDEWDGTETVSCVCTVFGFLGLEYLCLACGARHCHRQARFSSLQGSINCILYHRKLLLNSGTLRTLLFICSLTPTLMTTSPLSYSVFTGSVPVIWCASPLEQSLPKQEPVLYHSSSPWLYFIRYNFFLCN